MHIISFFCEIDDSFQAVMPDRVEFRVIRRGMSQKCVYGHSASRSLREQKKQTARWGCVLRKGKLQFGIFYKNLLKPIRTS